MSLPIDLIRVPYVLYGVEYIDLVSLQLLNASGSRLSFCDYNCTRVGGCSTTITAIATIAAITAIAAVHEWHVQCMAWDALLACGSF